MNAAKQLRDSNAQVAVTSPVRVEGYSRKELPSSLGTGQWSLAKQVLYCVKLCLHLLSSPMKFCKHILSTVDKFKDVCHFK